MKKFLSIFLCLAMLLSFAACGKDNKSGEQEQYTEDPQYTDPQPVNNNAVNPLTGIQDLDPAMKGHRIIGFSIGNTQDALPQSGPADCDLLLEIETEYGISRLMAFFADYHDAKRVGSIRSLRTQFLEAAYSLDAMIVHMGASSSGYDLLANLGYTSLDGNTCYEDDSCYRDNDRWNAGYPYEHTAFSEVPNVENSMKKYDIRTESSKNGPFFNFAKEGTKVTPKDGACTYAGAAFSDWFDTEIKYDSQSAQYELYQHGDLRWDEAAGRAPFKFDNVFFLVAVKDYYYAGNISPHYAYDLGGTAFYFSNGAYQKCTWTKPTSDDFFKFYDEDGNELVVNTGKTYMAILNQYQDWSIDIQ